MDRPIPNVSADGRQALRPAQAAPEVVVGQDHLDGVLPHRRGQVLEARPRTCWSPAASAPRGRRPPCPRSWASGPRGTPGRRRAPCRRGSRCRPSRRALGSSRSGWSGKAARRASMAAISSSGGNTPPLSLIAVKPYSSTIVRACATRASGSSAAPHTSSGGTGVAGPLVEEVGAVRDGVPDGPAQQVADRPAEQLALQVEGGDLEGREHPVQRSPTRSPCRSCRGRPCRRRPTARWPRDAAAPGRSKTSRPTSSRGRTLEALQVRQVAVGLAEPVRAGLGDDLHDRRAGRTARARRRR